MINEDFFSYFSLKPYVKTVQIRGHNKGFCAELTKLSLIITKYSSYLEL